MFMYTENVQLVRIAERFEGDVSDRFGWVEPLPSGHSSQKMLIRPWIQDRIQISILLYSRLAADVTGLKLLVYIISS